MICRIGLRGRITSKMTTIWDLRRQNPPTMQKRAWDPIHASKDSKTSTTRKDCASLMKCSKWIRVMWRRQITSHQKNSAKYLCLLRRTLQWTISDKLLDRRVSPSKNWKRKVDVGFRLGVPVRKQTKPKCLAWMVKKKNLYMYLSLPKVKKILTKGVAW